MIKAWLSDKLKSKSIQVNDFSEVLIRLLDYGVICRDENQTEQRLYDRFVQCAELVEDYLDVLGMRLQHNRRFCFVRVFPPGAEVPDLQDEEQSPFNSGFRARPSQLEVALILVLRVEYAKQLREGQVDEDGCVLVSVEAITIAFQNLLKRNLPDNLTERRHLFKRLRQLRLINFQQEDYLDSPESWLKIRPSITSFVTNEALDAIATREEIANLEKQKSQTEGELDLSTDDSMFNEEAPCS